MFLEGLLEEKVDEDTYMTVENLECVFRYCHLKHSFELITLFWKKLVEFTGSEYITGGDIIRYWEDKRFLLTLGVVENMGGNESNYGIWDEEEVAHRDNDSSSEEVVGSPGLEYEGKRRD
jgi:hypothetical protein